MTSELGTTVHVTFRFKEPPKKVFESFLDPAQASKFMFATASGKMVKVEIDPRVGGKYLFVDRRDGEDVEHLGEYLEINPPRRLVFTLMVEKYAQNIDRVSIDISPKKDGGCELKLTHEMGPEWEEHKAIFEEGWMEILQALAATLGSNYYYAEKPVEAQKSK